MGFAPTTAHRRAAASVAILVSAAMLAITVSTSDAAPKPARGQGRPAKSTSAADPTGRRERLSLARARRARLRWSGTLEFGIYPGGGAGAVNSRGEPRPEDPVRRQAALDQLRGGAARPFVVHLYDAYTGPADASAVPSWLQTQINGYTEAGLRVELVLRYRPSSGADVAGFTRFVCSRVQQLGPNRLVTSLQIGNEANVPGSPDAADGAYPSARQALVSGVVAAKQEARRLGHLQLAVGFNWANESPSAAIPFFSSLRSLGGRTFTRSVDWVGVDAYPGTWGPALPGGPVDQAVRTATTNTVDTLRTTLLPAAGLPRTPIVFAESGYPTGGADRNEATQSTVVRATVETVAALHESRGVIGYRWFDLRDADTSASGFESHYGLMADDYTPKPAFATYRDLVARHAG